MIRQSHKKSRTGCVSCKRRKINCDEGKPHCRNCRIHSTSCEYTATGDRRGPVSPQLTAQFSAPYGKGGDELIFGTNHMMLLHHFTVSTRVRNTQMVSFGYYRGVDI
ncbi:Sterol uptake control protein 2 like [Verticillium longisporum]|nr:Sterol uptake control protein 2 like [Verticillium longisporum]